MKKFFIKDQSCICRQPMKSKIFVVDTKACRVSIQRTLADKLVLWIQIFDWTYLSQEKASKKPLKSCYIFKVVKFVMFLGFFLRWVSPIKFLTSQHQLTSQSPLDRHPTCLCFDNKYFHFSIDFAGWRHMQDWSLIKNFFTDQLLY